MERRTAEMRNRGLCAVVFVCTNARTEHASCGAETGKAVADAARAWLRKRDRFWSDVAVVETSCLGMCSETGAAVVVYPHDEWLAAVSPADVPTLMTETVGDESATTDAAAE